jgi:hypothetical protein
MKFAAAMTAVVTENRSGHFQIIGHVEKVPEEKFPRFFLISEMLSAFFAVEIC